MALPSSGAISLGNIQTEFGGSNPISLSEYYQGGSIIGAGVYPNTIPASGVIQMDDFYSAESTHAYGGASSPTYTYNACMGYSIDYFRDNRLTVTVGYWGTGANTSTWTQLQFKTSSTDTANYNEIAQFTLTAANANVVQYGTIASGNMLYYSAQIFSNPVLYYGNDVNTSGGSSGAPGAAWMVAASWDGANTVYVYLNPSRRGTGDTGTTISMSNMGSTINYLNGGAGTGGAPAIITLSR
jgi:hypothetical protein